MTNPTSENKRAEVAVVRCSDYSNPEAVYRSLKSLLNHLGGMKRFVKKGERTLIKPNLLAGEHPDKAVTTHPSVVAGIVRLVGEAGGVPFIGESPAVAKLASVSGITGMTEVAGQYGAALVGLSTPQEIPLPDGLIMRRLTVAREALEANAIISVSKLKTHGYTSFTGAVKNLFGVIPGLLKADHHLRMPEVDDFSKMLLDVYAAIPARLHVMDAVWAMEGQKGPRAGNPKRVGLLIAGDDGVAVDAVATSIVGIETDSVPTIKIGHEEGIGVGRLEEIEVLGESFENIRVEDFEAAKRAVGFVDHLPPFLYRLLRDHVSNKPRIDARACRVCMTCAKACPPQAISQRGEDQSLRIDYNKCIRCFCCLETCPYDAVEIKEGFLSRAAKYWSTFRGK
jgi:uncharacterized protein (DUF362 family)/ferredoxin